MKLLKGTLARIPLLAMSLTLLIYIGSEDVIQEEDSRNSLKTTATKLPSSRTIVRSSAISSGRFFLCKDLVGGLGNRMFQYASVYGIAREKGMVPLIDARDSINDVFNVWALKTVSRGESGSVCDGMTKHRERRVSAYDESTISFPKNIDICLQGALQSFLYFHKYENELRSQFRFSDRVVNKAKEILNGNLIRLLGEEDFEKTDMPTLVAVHVRRGDKLAEVNRNLGMTVASREYILNAQDYFKEKYRNVVFVVCSDAMSWCFENLPKNRTIFVEGQDAITDLAIMSQCHHSLLTVGTFGWWMAWLVNGETVYYKRRVAEGSVLSKMWVLSDHFPPHWTPML